MLYLLDKWLRHQGLQCNLDIFQGDQLLFALLVPFAWEYEIKYKFPDMLTDFSITNLSSDIMLKAGCVLHAARSSIDKIGCVSIWAFAFVPIMRLIARFCSRLCFDFLFTLRTVIIARIPNPTRCMQKRIFVDSYYLICFSNCNTI